MSDPMEGSLSAEPSPCRPSCTPRHGALDDRVHATSLRAGTPAAGFVTPQRRPARDRVGPADRWPVRRWRHRRRPGGGPIGQPRTVDVDPAVHRRHGAVGQAEPRGRAGLPEHGWGARWFRWLERIRQLAVRPRYPERQRVAQRLTFRRRPDRPGRRLLTHLGLVGLAVAACSPAAGLTSGSSSAATASTGTSAGTGTPLAIGAGLSGPAGMTATVVATGLPNVASLAIDAAGRLWASTAAFDDTGTDGVYVIAAGVATPVVADLHTPLGLAWIDDRLYVASSAGVDAFDHFDGTRFASRTTVLELPDGVGEVNGLAVAPEGSLVVGISAPCDACDPDEPMAGAVVAFSPDGTDAHVLASGLRAPVGLAFVPGTSALIASENQRDDLGDATPGDWLIAVEAGQDWGFPACYGQGGPACDGAPSPLAVLDTHAAASGVAIVAGPLATATGGSTGMAAAVAEWAHGVVLATDLAVGTADDVSAAKPRTLISGLSQPVGVLAAGGALYVGDWGTGTIYRIAA